MSKFRDPGLWAAVVLALVALAGTWLRLTGLGAWPFATDEYYLHRAVEFVAESGAPAFPCGGYYARALLIQYLSAPFVLAGLQDELVLRLFSVVASLVAAAGVYRLGYRLAGRVAAIASTLVVLLSTWTIEIARFGRMYSMFQALFLWYAWHAVALIEDKNPRRWNWLLAISATAMFVWEGGIVLPLANVVLLLFVDAKRRFRDIVASILVLAGGLVFLTWDFRGLESIEVAQSGGPSGGLLGELPIPFLSAVSDGSMGILAAIIAAMVGLISIVLTIRGDGTLLSRVAVAGIAVAVVSGQVLLAGLAFVGAYLIGWLPRDHFARKPYRLSFLGLAVVAALWLAYGAVQFLASRDTADVKQFISFPELLYSLVYPWLATVPLMAIVLGFGGLAALALCAFANCRRGPAVLLVLLIVSVTIIGGANTLYDETRYSFHVYALLIILSGYALAEIGRQVSPTQSLADAIPFVLVLGFLASSDFDTRHLRTIDSYETNFRIGYNDRLARHYIPRFDFQSPAEFVNEQAKPGDLVVASNVVLDHYLEKTDFVYLAETDGRYRGQVCPGGERERWTGKPLISSSDALENTLAASVAPRKWLVVDWQTSGSTLPDEFLTGPLGMQAVFRSADDRFSVYLSGESADLTEMTQQ